jgi:uncharacterized membrane protein
VVCGDKGINDILGKDYWQSTVEIISSHFKNEDYKAGLIHGITEISEKLKQHFPYQSDDSNELSDEISKG